MAVIIIARESTPAPNLGLNRQIKLGLSDRLGLSEAYSAKETRSHCGNDNDRE